MPTTTISRCGGTPSGATFPTLVLESSPDAIWKMDELAGTTAFDTLAGHHDAATVGITPLWGQLSAPPGGFGPKFVGSPITGGFKTAWTPAAGGDLSAAVFMNIPSTGTQDGIGQGDPLGGFPGWTLYGIDVAGKTRFRATVWNGVTNVNMDCNVDVAFGTWVWLVVTHAGTLWTFYVNGVAQTATYSGAYTNPGAQAVWLGWNGIENYSIGNFYLSWGTMWSTRALSAS